MLWVRISIRPRCAKSTLCDKVCQWLAIGRWFSPDTPVSSNKRTDRYDITEILLKVALNTITNTLCNAISARLECGRFECRLGHRGESRLEKIWFFWRKIVIFHMKYPKNFRAFLRSTHPPHWNVTSSRHFPFGVKQRHIILVLLVQFVPHWQYNKFRIKIKLFRSTEEILYKNCLTNRQKISRN